MWWFRVLNFQLKNKLLKRHSPPLDGLFDIIMIYIIYQGWLTLMDSCTTGKFFYVIATDIDLTRFKKRPILRVDIIAISWSDTEGLCNFFVRLCWILEIRFL